MSAAATAGDALSEATDALETLDARIAELIRQAWRHAKPIGALSAGRSVLVEVGIPDAAGVVTASGTELVAELTALLAEHRVWQRFDATDPKG